MKTAYKYLSFEHNTYRIALFELRDGASDIH